MIQKILLPTTDSSEEEREETAGVETSDQTEEADLRKETKPQETLSEEKSVEAVIESAPKGLRLYDLMQKANTNKNNARVKTNSANNTDVVIITDDKKDNGGQAGAIWSEEGYRIDLRRSFHLKMKVYLGNKGKDAADGITFTMHNDPRKGNAIGHDGQSLGAMGNFKNKKPWTKDSGVIENSFSIEFDTHLNNDGNNESDKYNFQGKNKPHPAYHMSMYYPNLESSYRNMGILGTKDYSLFHERFSKQSESIEKATPDNTKFLTLPESPADGAWHDFSLDYERVEVDTEKGDFSDKIPLEQRSKYSYRLSYTFDGKTYEFYEKKTNEATTGLKNHHENSSLELNRLGVTRDPSDKPYEGETELTEDNPYVYWGLTGATGKQSSVQAVVFTELPDLGAPTVTQDVLKEDEGQDVSVNEINDTTIGPRPNLTIKSGDKLKYQYVIDFPKEGKQSIRNLEFDASFNDKIAKSVTTEDVKITYENENQKPGPGEENVGQVLPVENLSYKLDEHTNSGKLNIENFQAIGPGDGYPTRVKIEVPFIVDQDFTLDEDTTLQDNVVIGGTYEDQSTSRQLLTNQVKYTVKPFDGEITGNAIEVESRDLIKEAIHLQKAQVLKDRTLIPPNELETLIIEKIKKDDKWQLGSIPKDEWVKDLIISGLDRVTYHPGEYGLRATYNKGPKPYTDFRLIVSDGALEIKSEDGLDYQPKISSQKKQSALSTKRATVTVTDQRFAQDGWQVEVKASPFTKQNEEQEEPRLKLKIAETILQEASYIWNDGNNKSTCLEIGKKRPKNLNSFLPVELYMEDASTWARTKDNYHATVSWNLSPKTSNLPRVTLPKAREEEAP